MPARKTEPSQAHGCPPSPHWLPSPTSVRVLRRYRSRTPSRTLVRIVTSDLHNIPKPRTGAREQTCVPSQKTCARVYAWRPQARRSPRRDTLLLDRMHSFLLVYKPGPPSTLYTSSTPAMNHTALAQAGLMDQRSPVQASLNRPHETLRNASDSTGNPPWACVDPRSGGGTKPMSRPEATLTS